MLFNSLKFLLFFPAAVLIYYLVPPRARHVWLTLVSYFFYMCFAPQYGILLLGVTVITYFAGQGIERARRPKSEATSVKEKAGRGWL